MINTVAATFLFRHKEYKVRLSYPNRMIPASEPVVFPVNTVAFAIRIVCRCYPYQLAVGNNIDRSQNDMLWDADQYQPGPISAGCGRL